MAAKGTKKQRLQQVFAAWLALMLVMLVTAVVALLLGAWPPAVILGGIWLLMAGSYAVWWRSMPRRASRVLRDVFNLEIPPWFLPWSYRRHEHGIRTWHFLCPTPVTSSKLLMAYEYVAEHLHVDPYFEHVGRSRWRMEVATKQLPDKVHFHEFHQDQEPPDGELVFPIGESRGAPVWADFGEIYNLLVGGARGGGKSAALRQKLVWMVRHYDPSRLRLVLVDLAGGMEFGLFGGLKHLMVPIATELDSTLIALQIVKAEIKKREALFVEAEVTKLEEFNRVREPLPRILLVVDEWAQVSPAEASDKDDKDLRTEITSLVNAFIRLGRKFGLHIVLATQSPNVNVVTGQTRDNIDAKLAGFCATAIQSQMLLGSGNARASVLPRIPGRMLYLFKGREMHVQVPLLEPDEARELLSLMPKSDVPALPAGEEAGVPTLNVL